MKNLETFYNELIADADLQARLTAAAKDGKESLETFLKEHDVSASAEELQDFLAQKYKAAQELSDRDLTGVAGGYEAPSTVVDVDAQPLGLAVIPVVSFAVANVATTFNATAIANMMATANVVTTTNTTANVNVTVNVNVDPRLT